jgi:hypothetical protein
MYEMEGASPGLAAPGQPVAWSPGPRGAARWCRIPAADIGFPISATFPEFPPGAVPVSNGESISTAPTGACARVYDKIPASFFYPHSVHRTARVVRS